MPNTKHRANDQLRVAEYEQLSADWRHRDNVTWQMPAVLIAVAGLLVGEGVKIENGAPWIAEALFAFAAAFAVVMTVTLHQNLNLQDKGRNIIKSLDIKTKRFEFPLRGSWLLFWLSCVLSFSLLVLNFIKLSKLV